MRTSMLRLILIIFALLLAACDVLSSATTTPPASRPIVTSTPQPTPLVVSMAFTPAVVTSPIPSPTDACGSAPSTRMIVGERGRVLDEDVRKLNVRSGPGIEFRVLGTLDILEVFFVLDGPQCGGEFVWYLIQYKDLEGWIAEGDFGVYYVEPYLPG